MQAHIVKTVQDTVEGMVVEGVAALAGETHGHTGSIVSLPSFVTGLATAPTALPRTGFGLAAQLVVPPGSWAVVFAPGGEQRVYTPGSYWLWGTKPGALLVQWVDARRQQIPVGPVEGWSIDKWRVRLWLVAEVAVNDPALIALHREPLSALAAAMRTGALRYIEQHTHAQLTGTSDGAGGLDAPAEAIVVRLQTDPSLEGLQVVGLRVVERQGDERQIEAATAATVQAAQIDEELRVADARNRARLHDLQAQAVIAEREHTLRMAATAAAGRERLLNQQSEVQQAALAARLAITLAQIQAQTAEIARDEQQWQAEQARLQKQWERAEQQLLGTHHTDQQLRLMDAHQGLVRAEGETALAAVERHNAHELALAELQQRVTEQRAAQHEAIAERRAHHERTLLELHLRHEQLVAEQMQQLEQWRTQQLQVSVQQQRQHDRQLAAISGTAQIAAAAAALPADTTQRSPDIHEVADAGLRALQGFAE